MTTTNDRKTWFRCERSITNNEDGDTALISIYDEIGIWGVTAKDFRDELKSLGSGIKNIELSINSPGGEVFDGLAIHNLLARNKAKVTVRIDGLAASIASVIAMAGDEIIMPSNALMMIHDPSGLVVGTSRDMRELADALDKIKEGLISAYAGKSNMDRDEIADMMADEVWLTADEAIAMGFADVLEKPMRMAASFDLSKFRNAPAIQNFAMENENMNEEIIEPEVIEQSVTVDADASDADAVIEDPAEAAPEIIATNETRDPVEAERSRASAISAACFLAGATEKAQGFIDSGVSLDQAMKSLRDSMPKTADIVAIHEVATKNDSASWDRVMDKINARIN